MKWRWRAEKDDYEQEFETDQTEIHRAAEELSETRDWKSAQYPDERTFDIWCPKQQRWRTIQVYAENERHYRGLETSDSMKQGPQD